MEPIQGRAIVGRILLEYFYFNVTWLLQGVDGICWRVSGAWVEWDVKDAAAKDRLPK